MKKSLIALAVVVILAMTAALITPCFAADAEPIIFDLTVENTVLPGANGYLGLSWSGAKRGISEYDATEKAWKLENTKKIPGFQEGYEEFKFSEIPGYEEIDFEVYKYFVLTYKTVNMITLDPDNAEAGEDKVWLNGDGAVTILEDGFDPSDEYTNGVCSTEDFDPTHKIIVGIQAYSGGDLEPGAQIFIKYMAFFATEEEARAFDGTNDTSSQTPDTSEPEVSEPETSEPETSEPTKAESPTPTQATLL